VSDKQNIMNLIRVWLSLLIHASIFIRFPQPFVLFGGERSRETEVFYLTILSAFAIKSNCVVSVADE